MQHAAASDERSSTAWWTLAPFAGLFLLLIVFAVGGMIVVAHEADRSDAARAHEAVVRSFLAMLVRLDSAVDMNATTPPIVNSLLDPAATPAAAYGYLAFTNRDALGYYGTIVLNHDGSAFAGTWAGLPWTGPSLAAAARFVGPVVGRLADRGTGAARALLRDGDGRVVAVSAANLVAQGASAALAGVPPRRLAILSPVAAQLVPKMLPALGVEQFRLAATPDGTGSASFAVDRGAPLVFAWQPRSPGRSAIARWLPALGVLLLAAVILLVAAMRTSLVTTRQLHWLAQHDSLTDLPNRAAFHAELTARLGRDPSVAVGIVDLDGFKAVNDAHGHVVGDDLLRAVALELAAAALPGDFVARFGGDEFVWVSVSLAAAERLAADFARRLERPLIGVPSLRVRAATGIAVAERGMTVREVVAAADRRLYRRKAAANGQGDGAAQLAGPRNVAAC